jgi:hypothetical protein
LFAIAGTLQTSGRADASGFSVSAARRGAARRGNPPSRRQSRPKSLDRKMDLPDDFG